MKIKFWKIISSVLIFGVLAIVHAANSDAQELKPDLPTFKSWRGLEMGVTSVEDAKRILGKPRDEESEKLKIAVPTEWTFAGGDKSLLTLNYKEFDNYEFVRLTFAENKLILMDFLLKQTKRQGLAKSKSAAIVGKELNNIFQTDFLLVEKIPKNAKIADYEGQRETTIPKVYPSFYRALAINADVLLNVWIENSSFKSQWREMSRKPTAEMFPGFVQRIQVIQRAKESR